MYYESFLEVDIGSHPARERPGRSFFRNPYLLHKRIAAAFGRDPRVPTGMDQRAPRSENPGAVLFRTLLTRRPPGAADKEAVRVLVRSGVCPEWDKAFRKHSAKGLWLHLVSPPAVVERDPGLEAGETLRFSLRANPTMKRHERHEKNGERVSLCYPRHALDYLTRNGESVDEDVARRATHAELNDREARDAVVARACEHWLRRKGESGGFEVVSCISVREGLKLFKRPDGRKYADRTKDFTFGSVLYEGTLKVTDPEAFAGALVSGIGPGKAFGFGLLSVAPCG